MIAREFTYTADRFDADVETQMATLEWFTTKANGSCGSYEHHSLRMPHDGISAGVNRALDVMREDYPDTNPTVRRPIYRNGRFYAQFVIDVNVDNK